MTKGWMLSETYVVLMAHCVFWGEFGMQREQAFKLTVEDEPPHPPFVIKAGVQLK